MSKTYDVAVILRALATLLLAVFLFAGGRAHGARPVTVLFDEAHGQRFLAEKDGPLDLSALATLFRDEGLQVRTNGQPVTDHVLSGVDVLVISGPFAPYTPAEIDATTRFVSRGGRLCVMLHIGPPVAELLHRLNVSISNGVIRERENVINDDPLNFHVTRLTPHALTRNLDAFDVFGAWALLSTSENATVIAETGPNAWVDLNGDQKLSAGDAVQAFGVVVAGQLGKGRFAVFGDDAIFQNRFLTGGNLALGKNLVRWLREGTELT